MTAYGRETRDGREEIKAYYSGSGYDGTPYQATPIPPDPMYTKMKWVGIVPPLTVPCFFEMAFHFSIPAVCRRDPKGNVRGGPDRWL
ncbi:MAG: hypothetical protein ACLTSZ_18985 [Lachnospiraceae bacterium]